MLFEQLNPCLVGLKGARKKSGLGLERFWAVIGLGLDWDWTFQPYRTPLQFQNGVGKTKICHFGVPKAASTTVEYGQEPLRSR